MLTKTLIAEVNTNSQITSRLKVIPPLPIMVAGPFMMVTVFLSIILLGIASLKTKVFSAAPAFLLILGPILNFIPVVSDYSVLAWGIPFMWFGIEVLKKQEATTTTSL